jgi:hypothetical protein
MGYDFGIIDGFGLVVQETTRLLAAKGLVPVPNRLGAELPQRSIR